MTRDQAIGILDNLDIIRHYAHGGDVGFRLVDYKGEVVGLYPANGINLTGIRNNATRYVMLKAKFKWNPMIQIFERVERSRGSKVNENEVITRKGYETI